MLLDILVLLDLIRMGIVSGSENSECYLVCKTIHSAIYVDIAMLQVQKQSSEGIFYKVTFSYLL